MCITPKLCWYPYTYDCNISCYISLPSCNLSIQGRKYSFFFAGHEIWCGRLGYNAMAYSIQMCLCFPENEPNQKIAGKLIKNREQSIFLDLAQCWNRKR